MSGPKRADVEAQLNITRDAQRRCRSRIAKVDAAVAASLAGQARAAAKEADAVARDALARLAGLSRDEGRLVTEAVGRVTAAAEGARGLAARAQASAELARTEAAAADQAQAAANRAFEAASAAYEAAQEATRSAGAHYLTAEMAKARAAQAEFDKVDEAVKRAEGARGRATKAAQEARQLAGEAAAAAATAREQATALRAEAKDRLAAEENAKSIVEQRQRAARLAVDEARAALRRLEGLPHHKFQPGAGDALKRAADAAAEALDRGRADDARAAAERIPGQVVALAAQVEAAAAAFDARSTAAATAVAGAEAASENVDAALVTAWATHPEALQEGRDALDRARRAQAGEDFDVGLAQAAAAREALENAMRSAAENLANHEKRESVGEAIMDVLGDLGFDVSCEAGTRDEPLRISGQTPDESGRGDFDVHIPLDGEIDFEVTAAAGDNACVSAIEELRKRLAERGITWTTTDWGHAEGSAPAAQRQKTMEKETQKAKQRGGAA